MMDEFQWPQMSYTYPKITLIHWDFISDMFKLKLLTKSAKFTLPNPLIRYMAKSSHILEPMLEKLESSKIYCVTFFIHRNQMLNTNTL